MDTINIKKRTFTISQAIKARPDIINFLSSNKPLSKIFDLPNQLNDERLALYRKSYQGIGETSCYSVNLNNENRLYIKTEYMNQMGNNHYARYWFINLFISEILGVISPGQTHILEISSGSSGISLATACKILGYQVTIIVPSALPQNRTKPMKDEQAKVMKVDGYIYECNLKLKELLSSGNYFATNHSEEGADIITSVFSRIGYEFIEDKLSPDYAFLAIGNGTSTEAISIVFKQSNKDCKILGYHPNVDKLNSSIVLGLKPPLIKLRHNDSALKYVDKIMYTDNIDLNDIKIKYENDTEISNFGYSSLYGVKLAIEMAKEVKNKIFFSMAYDKINRY